MANHTGHARRIFVDVPPLIVTWPNDGFVLPFKMPSNVDLPEPLPPMMPTSCPPFASKLNW